MIKIGVLFFIFLVFLSNFILAEEGETGTQFFIEGAECNSGADWAYWRSFSNENDIVWIYNSTYTDVRGLCNLSSVSCCPIGMQCVNGLCFSSGIVDDCTDFLSESSCSGADPSFASYLIESFRGQGFVGLCNGSRVVNYIDFSNGEVLCTNYTFCGCSWSSGRCGGGWSDRSVCGDDIVSEKNCVWIEESRQDLCGEDAGGKIIINYTASGSALGDPLCLDQNIEYPCSVSVKLPFFDKFSFVFAGVAIVVVYFTSRRIISLRH